MQEPEPKINIGAAKFVKLSNTLHARRRGGTRPQGFSSRDHAAVGGGRERLAY